MGFLQNLFTRKSSSALKELKKRKERYNKCFRCGSSSQPSRLSSSGSWTAGQVVSGRLWYCPKCDRMCCIPCAKPVSNGIVCPRCGSDFEQHPPSLTEQLEQNRDIENLIRILLDKDQNELQDAAASALGRLGDLRAVELLIRVLQEQVELRGVAADALGKLGDLQAVEPLIDATKGRACLDDIAKSLGILGDSRAVEPLIELLKENGSIRWEAIIALGKIKNIRAVEPLIAILKEGKNYYRDRELAAQALGKLGDLRAVEPLKACLDDKDSFVRQKAAESLQNLVSH